MKFTNALKNKKFRYGAASVVFTAVILALIVMLNAVFTLLASNFHWYVDMTEEQLFSVSDTSRKLLEELEFDGKLSMIFLQEKDKIEDSTYTYQGDEYLWQIHELALDYAAKFPELIELKYVDMYTDPGKLKTYTDQNMSMNPTSVIFDNNKGIFRISGYSSFLAYDSESGTSAPVGFYGEHKITATVLALCREKQTVYLTAGHNEDTPGEAFITVLESCGYNNIETVNLQELTVEKLMEDRPKMIVMLNPKTDLVGADGGPMGNEVAWISRIMDGSYMGVSDDPALASLLAFVEPGYEMPNLNTLTVTWGMTMHTSSADLVKENERNSFGNAELYKILPAYCDSSSIGYSLVRKLTSKIAMDGAGTISVVDVSAKGEIANGSVLNVSSSAVCENEKYPAAGMSVLSIGQNRTSVKGNYYKYNYMMLCADTSIVSDDFLRSSSYANEALITNIVRATVDESERPEAIEIEYKDYRTESNVSNVSAAEKKAFLVFAAVVIPAALLIAGVTVYVRRRNK